MRRTRRWWVVALLVALGFAGGGFAWAGETAYNVLTGRGLTKAGKFFIVPSEAEFLDRWSAVLPEYQGLAGDYVRLVEIQQAKAVLFDLNDELILRRQQLQEIDAELGALPAGGNSAIKQRRQDLNNERKGVDNRRAALRAEIDRRMLRVPPDPQVQKLYQAFERRRQQFLDRTSSVRPLADQVLKQYGELSRDPAVTNALKLLRQSTKSALSLGPSPEFQSAQKQLKDAQRSVQPDAPRSATKNRSRTKKGRS